MNRTCSVWSSPSYMFYKLWNNKEKLILPWVRQLWWIFFFSCCIFSCSRIAGALVEDWAGERSLTNWLLTSPLFISNRFALEVEKKQAREAFLVAAKFKFARLVIFCRQENRLAQVCSCWKKLLFNCYFISATSWAVKTSIEVADADPIAWCSCCAVCLPRAAERVILSSSEAIDEVAQKKQTSTISWGWRADQLKLT